MTETFVLRPGRLRLADLRRASEGDVSFALDPAADAGIKAAHAVVARAIADGRRIYGVNTGFGSLAATTIAPDEMRELQARLVRANAVGSGPPLPDGVVRRMMLLKVNALSCGRSGVRRELIDALLAMLNRGLLPLTPAKGSVGSSGDLAPLAHLALALMGEGEARFRGETLAAAEGMARAGLAPLALEPKEGLSLCNGTEASTALGLEALFALENIFAAALVAGSLTLEAALGRSSPFDARLHEARGQAGEIEIAAAFRDLLADSGLRAEAEASGRLQDPYSLRCQPQVLGACLDHLRFAASLYEREANSVADNPLVFAEDDAIVFGGNFHAVPVGMAADVLALVLAEVGGLSERRLALLVDGNFSGLPAFLALESGLNSGFMAAHIAAAALASENKALAHPYSADSIPTVANFEDYVSMATSANRRLLEMVENAATIVAIELLAAAQGIDLRRPLATSETLERVVAVVRARVPMMTTDRYLSPEIAAIAEAVLTGAFREFVPAALMPSADTD